LLIAVRVQPVLTTPRSEYVTSQGFQQSRALFCRGQITCYYCILLSTGRSIAFRRTGSVKGPVVRTAHPIEVLFVQFNEVHPTVVG